jgi:hypothetical protein
LAKDIKVGFANINAKAEGIDNRPAFRDGFQRCAVKPWVTVRNTVSIMPYWQRRIRTAQRARTSNRSWLGQPRSLTNLGESNGTATTLRS